MVKHWLIFSWGFLHKLDYYNLEEWNWYCYNRNFSSFPLMPSSVVFFLSLLLTWVHKYLKMPRASSPFSVRLWLIPQIQLWWLLFFEQYLMVLFRLINTASKWRKLYVYNHQFHWLCCAMSSFLSFVRFCFRLTFVSWSNGKSFLNFSQFIFFLT